MPSAADTRLAWAVRAWEAEVENASRLANRANLVLTIALAFSGFGLKELSDALRTHPSSWISQASLAIAVVGVTLIFWAFVKVLARRSSPESLSRPPFASWDLLPPGDLEPVAAEEEMLTRAYRATSAAAYELHGRNATERERLNVAQQFLVLGAVLTLLGGGAYTICWEAPGGSATKCSCCGSPAPAGN
jgi:hypothetical protein